MILFLPSQVNWAKFLNLFFQFPHPKSGTESVLPHIPGGSEDEMP